MNWNIGCSGFHYKHWKELFYPPKLPQRLWFHYYCNYFNTLELNVTFYRFPTVSMLRNWYNQSRNDFLFTLKVPRAITQFKKLVDAKNMLKDFYSIVGEGLQHKAGCILFQFPPSFKYSEEHLERILLSVNPAFQNVVEFRDKSWWNEKAIAMLGANRIAFCGMSYPDFPDLPVRNTGFLYYRFHGVPRLYESPYTCEKLEEFAARVSAFDNLNQVFVFFNNDIGGSAIKNALELKEIVNRE